MPLNGSVKGPGGSAPLTSQPDAPIARPSPAGGPQRSGATLRPQATGGPPVRANSLQASAGNRPQAAALPQRRATLPPSFPAPASSSSTLANGAPDGAMPASADPATAPPHGQHTDPLKQLESLLKSQKKHMDKYIELTNKATDGVGAAVSARIA